MVTSYRAEADRADIDGRSARRPAAWLAAILAVIAIVLAAQTWLYSGLIRWLAETQFDLFDRYFPTLTIVLLVGLAALAWLAIGRLRRWAAERSGARSRAPVLDPLLREVRRASVLRRFFQLFTGFAALATVLTFLHWLQLPGPTAMRRIDLASAVPISTPEGTTTVRNIRALGPISRYSEDLLFWRHTMYLIPVARTRTEDSREAAHLFVQVPSGDPRAIPRTATGLLRHDALPHEIAAMYRYARYPVARRSMVLFANEKGANLATAWLMAKLGLVTLIGTAFAVGARRRERRIAGAPTGSREVATV